MNEKQKTVTGNPIMVSDALQQKLNNYQINGNTERVVSKNLIIAKELSQEKNGVTIKINSDKSITINGTATAKATFYIPCSFVDVTNKCYFSGFDSVEKCWLEIETTDRIGERRRWWKSNCIVDCEKYKPQGIDIVVDSGYTATNLVFKPQLEIGSKATEYEPYFEPYVADSKVTEIKNCGKNLINNTAKTQTVNGVTFTVNEDKSVTVNGTATDTAYLRFSFFETLKAENYCLSGCPKGGSKETYYFAIGEAIWKFDIGNGVKFNVPKDIGKGRFEIVVSKGVVCNNLVFKPQLEIGDKATEYEPYKEQKVMLSEAIDLTKWDKIIKQNGVWGILKTSHKVTFDGSEVWYVAKSSPNFIISRPLLDCKKTDPNSKASLVCNNFNANYSTNQMYSGKYGIGIKNNDLWLSKDSLTSMEEFKTWLSQNPTTVVYETGNSTFVPLSEQDQITIEKLQLYRGANTLYCEYQNLSPIQSLTYLIKPNTINAKTDWKVTRDENGVYTGDYFQYTDYNRIGDNYKELFDVAKEYIIAELEPMPKISGYAEHPTENIFNLLENNAKKVYTNSEVKLYPTYESKVWVANQSTPTYLDLNRLEKLCLDYYNLYKNNSNNIPVIEFTLGGSEFE